MREMAGINRWRDHKGVVAEGMNARPGRRVRTDGTMAGTEERGFLGVCLVFVSVGRGMPGSRRKCKGGTTQEGDTSFDHVGRPTLGLPIILTGKPTEFAPIKAM